MASDVQQPQALVTGGAGFIGSHLAEHLLNQGGRVVLLDSFDSFYDRHRKEKNIAAVQKHKNGKTHLELIEGDILDQELLSRLFQDHSFHTVYHLAAKAGVRPSIEEPMSYARTNVDGTLSLLNQCAHSEVKNFVFASSSSVYGNNPVVPFQEDQPVDHPISPYAATKKAAELLAHTFHSLYQMNIACARLFTVYGPRQRPDLAIHKFTRSIFEGRPISLFGDGTTSRDYTFVSDICAGLIACANWCETESRNQGHAVFDIFNLGNSSPVQLIQLVELLEEVTGRKAQFEKKEMQKGDVDRTFADISKAQKLIGYKPQVELKKGLEEFVKWIKQENLY